MSLSRREANKINTRHRILKASRRSFKEKGYDNTMIDDVADKAEISKATLYKYFPSKESLLAGTLDEQIEAARQIVDSEMEDCTDSYEKIKKLLEFLVADSVMFIDISRRIMFLNACEESDMFSKADPVKDMFKTLVEAAKDEGIFNNKIETEDITELIIGVYLSSQFGWSDMGEDSPEMWGEKAIKALELALTGCVI